MQKTWSTELLLSFEKKLNTVRTKVKLEQFAPNRRRRFKYYSYYHQKVTTDTTEFKYYEITAKVT